MLLSTTKHLSRLVKICGLDTPTSNRIYSSYVSSRTPALSTRHSIQSASIFAYPTISAKQIGYISCAACTRCSMTITSLSKITTFSSRQRFRRVTTYHLAQYRRKTDNPTNRVPICVCRGNDEYCENRRREYREIYSPSV